MLQEQLDELWTGPEADDNNEEEQEPEPAQTMKAATTTIRCCWWGDAKEEEFLRHRTWYHAARAAGQVRALQRGPEAEDDCKQEPEPAGRVIPDNAGGNNDNTD